MENETIEGYTDDVLKKFMNHNFWVHVLIEDEKITLEVPNISQKYLTRIIKGEPL